MTSYSFQEKVLYTFCSIGEVNYDIRFILGLGKFLHNIALAHTACAIDKQGTLARVRLLPFKQFVVNLALKHISPFYGAYFITSA